MMQVQKNLPTLLLIVIAFFFGIIATHIMTSVFAAAGYGALVNGCVTAKGILSVSTTGTCKNGETLIHWYQAQLTPGQGQLLSTLSLKDLASLDGRYRDWTGADLSGITLAQSFDHAVLVGANLTNTVLSSFVSADLSHANLSGDDLSGKHFENALLTGANLSNTTLNNVFFTNASASGMIVTGANFVLVKAEGANFSNVDFTQITSSTLGEGVGIDFIGANLTNANFSGLTLRAQFSNANLTNANLSNVTIHNSFLFDGANLQNTNMSNLNLTNANLSGATNFATANTTGVTWSNTTCPDGTNSNNDGGTCVGH